MIYNKEYIEQLLRRFMDGETIEQEEQFLTEYFSKSDSIPEEWEAYREMFDSFATDAYDFTEEELSTFVKEETPKPRNIKMWPWLAAACVAALLVIFLAPPRAPHPQEGEFQIAHAVKDSVMQDKPETKNTQPLIANAPNEGEGRRVRKSPVVKNEKPLVAKTECETTSDEPATIEDNLMAEQPPQFQEMENAFLLHSAPIRERGQQVIHRVSMLQKEQRNQQQYVEL